MLPFSACAGVNEVGFDAVKSPTSKRMPRPLTERTNCPHSTAFRRPTSGYRRMDACLVWCVPNILGGKWGGGKRVGEEPQLFATAAAANRATTVQ
jgi:hypothetical protein